MEKKADTDDVDGHGKHELKSVLETFGLECCGNLLELRNWAAGISKNVEEEN